MKWTASQLGELQTMWLDPTIAIPTIAKHFDTTRNAVIGAAHRHVGDRKAAGPPPKPIKHSTVERRERRARQRAMAKARAAAKPKPPKQGAASGGGGGNLFAGPPPRFPAGSLASRPTIFGLRDSHCHWPMWEGHEPIEEKTYCGERPTAPGGYCLEHAALSVAGRR